jgi:hypothetical protein
VDFRQLNRGDCAAVINPVSGEPRLLAVSLQCASMRFMTASTALKRQASPSLRSNLCRLNALKNRLEVAYSA